MRDAIVGAVVVVVVISRCVASASGSLGRWACASATVIIPSAAILFKGIHWDVIAEPAATGCFGGMPCTYNCDVLVNRLADCRRRYYSSATTRARGAGAVASGARSRRRLSTGGCSCGAGVTSPGTTAPAAGTANGGRVLDSMDRADAGGAAAAAAGCLCACGSWSRGRQRCQQG